MSTFEVLARDQAEEQQMENRSIVAARVRAQEAFGDFLANGNRQERLAWVDPDLEILARSVAEEYGYTNIEHIKTATRSFLALDKNFKKEVAEEAKEEGESFEHEMKEKREGDEDDENGEWKKPWEKKANKYIEERDGKWVITQKGTGKVLSTHDSQEQAQQSFEAMEAHKHGRTAADVDTGDTFQSERVDLPSNKVDGLGDTGSVPTDKSKSGDNTGWSLKPIDVGSKQHTHSVQDITERADYKKTDFVGDSLSTTVDVDSAMQPEHLKGDRTKTWSGTEGQKDPVTNQSLSKYKVVSVSQS